MYQMKTMGNARPLANEECIVLAHIDGNWKWFESAEMKYYDGGKYEWIDLETNQPIPRVMEWKYK